MSYYLTVYNERQHEQLLVDASVMVLGAAPPRSLDHFVVRDESLNDWHLQVCRLAHQAADRVSISNQGQFNAIVDGADLTPQGECECPLPVRIMVGSSCIQLSPGGQETRDNQRIGFEDSTLTRLDSEGNLLRPTTARAAKLPAPSSETLIRWFASLGEIQRHASCSPEFYQAALEAVVSPGGLSSALLLKPKATGWEIVASHVASPPDGIAFDPQLVNWVAAHKQTLFHAPAAEVDHAVNWPDECALAAPVFNDQREVVAVLYATRRTDETDRRRGIRHVEAYWIQLVAESLTTGVLRRTQESERASQRVLLEQAFPPAVLDQLTAQKQLRLATESRLITTMFADLFDSLSLAESVPPDQLYHLLGDVLDVMTRAVQQEQGVIVDYYGDGLVAMWNAPIDQKDHAVRACRAALRIREEMAPLRDRWSHRLSSDLRVGIGIHSGECIVGNSGSRHRLKYGPRGALVKIASRIEKATRRLGCSILMSETTRRLLPPGTAVQRLGNVRLDGWVSPFNLFTLHGVGEMSRPTSEFRDRLADYEWTLRLIEQQRLPEAAANMSRLEGSHLDDSSLEVLRRHLENAALTREGAGRPHRRANQTPVLDLSMIEAHSLGMGSF